MVSQEQGSKKKTNDWQRMARTNNFFDIDLLGSTTWRSQKFAKSDDGRFQATPSKEAMQKEVPWGGRDKVAFKVYWIHFFLLVLFCYILFYIVIFMLYIRGWCYILHPCWSFFFSFWWWDACQAVGSTTRSLVGSISELFGWSSGK